MHAQSPSDQTQGAGGIGVVPVVTFVAAFANTSSAPILFAVAQGFGTELRHAAWIVTAYALAYGVAQLFWGALAVRFGKRTILRVGLASAAVWDLVSVFAWSLEALIVLRVLAGMSMGAVIPCVIGLIGDSVPLDRRQRSMTNLITGHAAGTALGTLCAGVAADLVSWRAVFAIGVALGSAGVLVGGLLPAGHRDAAANVFTIARRMPAVFRHRWSRLVVVFGVLEGAILFALVHFLSPALIVAGMPARWAGAIVAAYGLSVLGWSRVANLATRRLTIVPMMGIGVAMMICGHAAAAIEVGPGGIFVASLLLSGATAFLHSGLQVWSTEAAPELRGLVVPAFACALFTGSAGMVQVVAQAETTADFAIVYAGAAVASIAFGAAVMLTRRAYESEMRRKAAGGGA